MICINIIPSYSRFSLTSQCILNDVRDMEFIRHGIIRHNNIKCNIYLLETYKLVPVIIRVNKNYDSFNSDMLIKIFRYGRISLFNNRL